MSVNTIQRWDINGELISKVVYRLSFLVKVVRSVVWNEAVLWSHILRILIRACIRLLLRHQLEAIDAALVIQLQRQSLPCRGSTEASGILCSIFELAGSVFIVQFSGPTSLWPVERNVARSVERLCMGHCCYEKSFHARLTSGPPRPTASWCWPRDLHQFRASPTSDRPAAVPRPTSDHSMTTTSMTIMIVDAAAGLISDSAVHSIQCTQLALRQWVTTCVVSKSYWRTPYFGHNTSR